MQSLENLKVGLAELKSNKLRTALTMLGIIFGVGSVIAMLSIGEGARQETIEQIELLGTNNLIIKEKTIITKDEKTKTNFSPGLNLKDVNAIKEINPYVKFVTPENYSSTPVMFKSKIISATVIGTDSYYPETYNSNIKLGDFFSNKHMASYSNVCVIGPSIEEEFFRLESPINKMIKIDDLWFKVVGVTGSKNITSSSTGNLGIRDFNKDIYIPITTMMYKLENKDQANNQQRRSTFRSGEIFIPNEKSVQQITVKIKNNAPLNEAVNLTKRILERRHYGVNDFEIIVPEALLEQKQKTQIIFNIVMGAIAGISLLVGGIGIMNIMMSNIIERTKEIGIRRAVGATKNDVLSQFMFEAVAISIIGGILGIITGFFLTSLITGFAGWRTVISPFSIALAFFVSCFVGIVFGIFPAKKAAAKNPIDALRYE